MLLDTTLPPAEQLIFTALSAIVGTVLTYVFVNTCFTKYKLTL
jgi:hypothetical protein